MILDNLLFAYTAKDKKDRILKVLSYCEKYVEFEVTTSDGSYKTTMLISEVESATSAEEIFIVGRCHNG